MREYDQYIPSLWVMCLESMAHLLVMLNVSSNFLIYCSVSSPFKVALSKVSLARNQHPRAHTTIEVAKDGWFKLELVFQESKLR